jgi:hypothetical protein
VVLFLDEFDRLYSSAPAAIQDSVLVTLRRIKEMSVATRLRAVVGVGAYGILELIGKTGSPFNVHATLQVPCFTEEQVFSLFREYEQARGVTLDERIILDVFDQTRGHAGSVTFMGRFIDEQLQPNERPHIGYDAWARAGSQMRRKLGQHPNWMRLINVLRSPEDGLTDAGHGRSAALVLAARKLLVWMLHSSEPVLLTQEEERLARFVAAESALLPVENAVGKFMIHSAAIRAVLCENVLSLERRKIPVAPVPMVGCKVLISGMLRQALQCFDRNMCTAARLFKKSFAPGAVGTFAAQEDVFQTELLTVLKAWLPAGYSVLSQPPLVAAADRAPGTGRPKHSGMLIPAVAGQHAVLFELAAQVSEAGMHEHMVRARSDAAALGAEEAWVVHFTTGEFGAWPTALLEQGEVPVHVMHIKYDSEWTYATIRVDGGRGQADKVDLA